LRKDQKAGLFLGRVPVKQTDSKDGLQLFSLMYPASHAKLLQRFESLSLLSSSDLERARAGTKSDPKSALEWRNKVKFFMYGQGFISYVIPAADDRALLLDQASLMPVGIVPKSKPEGNLTLGFRVHEVGALEIPGGQLYYPQNLSLHDHDMIVHLHAKKITQAPTMDVKLVDLDHVNKTATSGDASLSDQARTLSELLMKFF
jgi:hypothetical protein